MNSIFSSYPKLEKDLSEVKNIILEQLDSPNKEMSSGLKELALSTGKLLRPAFLILCGRLGNFRKDKLYSLAAAVEMLHMATLIHDDIVDDSPVRRGKPALHVTQGKKNAVLMGDLLFSRCFRLSAQHAKIETSRILSAAVERICESEIAEVPEGIPSLRTYLRKTAGKTSVLFAVSCYAGAKESGCPQILQDALRRAGYSIGMGFQIIDDILDYTGDEKLLGKPVGNDLREGIFTLPIILAAKDKPKEIASLAASLRKGEASADYVISRVKSLGGIDSAGEYARKYTKRALNSLRIMPSGWPKDALLDLTESLLVRTY